MSYCHVCLDVIKAVVSILISANKWSLVYIAGLCPLVSVYASMQGVFSVSLYIVEQHIPCVTFDITIFCVNLYTIGQVVSCLSVDIMVLTVGQNRIFILREETVLACFHIVDAGLFETRL